MRINLVVARAHNGVIGRQGTLPWHLPADLKRFREITTGHPIVMGRLTHQSIGRVLPGRRNLVVTSHPDAVAPGATAVPSLEAALVAAGRVSDVMIIGGVALYEATLPRADRIYLTEVHADIEGDVTFPPLAPAQWREVAREDHPADTHNPLSYSFVILDRRPSS